MVRKAAGAKMEAAEQQIGVESVAVETLAGWESLSPKERKTVTGETAALVGDLQVDSRIKLSIGRHISNIQAVLEPKRMFGQFMSMVAKQFNKSERTLYRYMESFRDTVESTSPRAVEVAIERNVDLTGKAAKKAIQAVPPIMPNSSHQETERWVEHVASQKKAASKVSMARTEPKTYSAEDSIRDILKLYDQRFALLGTVSPKTKQRFLGDCVGGMLVISGIGNPATFVPVALPAGVRSNGEAKRRGRPPKKQVASAPIVAASNRQAAQAVA